MNIRNRELPCGCDLWGQRPRIQDTAREHVSILAGFQFLAGVAWLISPQVTGSFFSLDIDDDATLLPRLFGARETMLGAYTWWYLSYYMLLIRTMPLTSESHCHFVRSKVALMTMLQINYVVHLADGIVCSIYVLKQWAEADCAMSFGVTASNGVNQAQSGILGIQ